MDILTSFYEFYQYWLIIITGLISIWYLYCTWNFDYWKKQGVPGEKPRLIMGTLKPTWIHPFQDQDIDAMKKYGHVHGGFMGTVPVLYLSDPDLVRQVLVKDFHVFPNRRVVGGMDKDKFIRDMLTVMSGEKWKMVRNTLTPTYTSGKLKQMVYLIEECTQHLVDTLQTEAEAGEPIEFTKKFAVLTLDIIASCAFGMKSDCIKNPDSEFVLQAQKAFRGNAKLIYTMFTMPYLLKLIPKSIIPNPFTYFMKIADQTIEMRLKNKNFVRRDFLQIMLEAEVPSEDNKSSDKTDETQKQQIGSKRTLTRETVIAQTVLFIMAGHETTANTLNLMAYELALNQDIQDKLIKEVDDTMADCKGQLSYETVASMKYLEMTVNETLRKYPPAVRTDRQCEKDEYKINDILIKKGVVIGIPIYAMHHNPEWYPNPEKFDPERFNPEKKPMLNPFVYLPFGAGPRNCIAMRFALLEIKLVMTRMLYNYRFQACSETEYPVSFNVGMGLLQPKSIQLTIQKRIDQPHFF